MKAQNVWQHRIARMEERMGIGRTNCGAETIWFPPLLTGIAEAGHNAAENRMQGHAGE